MQNPIQEKTKLPLLFDFILEHNAPLHSKKFEKARYEIYSYAVRLFGYNKLPQVVSDSEYAKLKRIEVYRGVPENEYNANLLVDFDYHFGKGFGANGIYCASNKKIAYLYADKNENNVLSLKLADDANVAVERDVVREFERGFDEKYKMNVTSDTKALAKLIKKIKSQPDQELVKWMLKADGGILAMLYGYDALADSSGSWGCNVLSIMNREKIIVSQSEFDRVCAQSKAYKDGTINFKEKEYLDE